MRRSTGQCHVVLQESPLIWPIGRLFPEGDKEQIQFQ